jgi:hypothetical protein
VAAIQACTDGNGLAAVHYDSITLAVLGAVSCFAGTKLFRWNAGQSFRSITGKAWLIPALIAWLTIGLLAGRNEMSPPVEIQTAPPAKAPKEIAPAVRPVAQIAVPKTWTSVTAAEVAALNYKVPPDNGVVTPIAQPEEQPDESTDATLENFQLKLVDWPPAHVTDPVQRALNLLSVAAVTDLAQDPAERFVPLIILDYLSITTPHDELVKLLAWIALHPGQGETINDLSDLGLGGVSKTPVIRERVNIYAVKFLVRLNDKNSALENK